MQEFYQKPNESITALKFRGRLKFIFQITSDGGFMQKLAKNDLLRYKFWTSLKSDNIKYQTRHKYDTVIDFHELVREIRMVEREIKIRGGTNLTTNTNTTISSGRSSYHL